MTKNAWGEWGLVTCAPNRSSSQKGPKPRLAETRTAGLLGQPLVLLRGCPLVVAQWWLDPLPISIMDSHGSVMQKEYMCDITLLFHTDPHDIFLCVSLMGHDSWASLGDFGRLTILVNPRRHSRVFFLKLWMTHLKFSKGQQDGLAG